MNLKKKRYRPLLAILLISLIIFGHSAMPVCVSADDETIHKNGNILAGISGEYISIITDRLSDAGILYTELAKTDSDVVILSLSCDDLNSDELMESARNMDGVLYTEENTRILLCDNDNSYDDNTGNEDLLMNTAKENAFSYSDYQWYLGNKTGFQDADSKYSINLENNEVKRNVVVAVLDTGIDYSHSNLKDRMIDLSKEQYGTIIEDTGCGKYGYNAAGNDSSDPMDQTGHGTHVAGIIGGLGQDDKGNETGPEGIMSDCNLLAVKIFRDNGYSYISDIVKGKEWLYKAKTEYGVDVAVVNCSYSYATTGYMSITEKLMNEKLEEAGIVICRSSGNSAINVDSEIESVDESADTTIVVDALDFNGNVSSFSNYGYSTDLFAPGEWILSSAGTDKDNTEGLFLDGEKGTAILYSGFENEDEELAFTSDKPEQLEITDEKYFTGNQSLKVSLNNGSVLLTSDPINLSKTDLENAKLELYEYSDTSDFYIAISIKVIRENGESSYELYRIDTKNNTEDSSGLSKWMDSNHFDGQNFLKKVAAYENTTVHTVLLNTSQNVPSSLSEWENRYGKDEWSIDKDNFEIRIEAGSLNSTISNGVITGLESETSIYLDSIVLTYGNDIPAIFLSGTSQATPMVSAAYGIVYSTYAKENDEDEEYECKEKMVARILGSVNTADANEDLFKYCLTGGYLDIDKALSIDESVFSPVLQSYSFSNGILTIKGWFLGSKKNAEVYLGDSLANILSFKKDSNQDIDTIDCIGEIQVEIPEDIGNEQLVRLVNGEGKSGKIWLDEGLDELNSDYSSIDLPDELLQDEDNHSDLNKGLLFNKDNALVMYLEYDSSSRILEYNGKNSTWKLISEIQKPEDIEEMTIVCYRNEFYGLATDYFDGIPVSETLYKLAIDNSANGTWEKVGSIKESFNSRLFVYRDKLLLVGGNSNETSEYLHSIRQLIINNDSIGTVDILTDSDLVFDCQGKITSDDKYIYLLQDNNSPLLIIDISLHSVSKETESTFSLNDSFFSITDTPDGLILNKISTDGYQTVFYDTEEKKWEYNEKVLYLNLTEIFDSITIKNTSYILGTRNDSTKLFLSGLSYSEDANRIEYCRNDTEDLMIDENIGTQYIKNIQIDKQFLDPDNYSFSFISDQQILLLHHDILNELTEGIHTLTVYYKINGYPYKIKRNLEIFTSITETEPLLVDEKEEELSVNNPIKTDQTEEKEETVIASQSDKTDIDKIEEYKEEIADEKTAFDFNIQYALFSILPVIIIVLLFLKKIKHSK